MFRKSKKASVRSQKRRKFTTKEAHMTVIKTIHDRGEPHKRGQKTTPEALDQGNAARLKSWGGKRMKPRELPREKVAAVSACAPNGVKKKEARFCAENQGFSHRGANGNSEKGSFSKIQQNQALMLREKKERKGYQKRQGILRPCGNPVMRKDNDSLAQRANKKKDRIRR